MRSPSSTDAVASPSCATFGSAARAGPRTGAVRLRPRPVRARSRPTRAPCRGDRRLWLRDGLCHQARPSPRTPARLLRVPWAAMPRTGYQFRGAEQPSSREPVDGERPVAHPVTGQRPPGPASSRACRDPWTRRRCCRWGGPVEASGIVEEHRASADPRNPADQVVLQTSCPGIRPRLGNRDDPAHWRYQFVPLGLPIVPATSGPSQSARRHLVRVHEALRGVGSFQPRSCTPSLLCHGRAHSDRARMSDRAGTTKNHSTRPLAANRGQFQPHRRCLGEDRAPRRWR